MVEVEVVIELVAVVIKLAAVVIIEALVEVGEHLTSIPRIYYVALFLEVRRQVDQNEESSSSRRETTKLVARSAEEVVAELAMVLTSQLATRALLPLVASYLLMVSSFSFLALIAYK